ncbi:hypothetical protein [Sanguibacter suaedae]|uniref:Uncharacterized protein n=1 Tax=Sanguibacter suaedae TaxID=2795737 RepID=A0A934MAI0_9MICO|nr:hypothetical protein [Sanguibacter suaedae]MBI9115630.1 hypothetical protein [Sanguibacter suaedae]
MGSIPLNPLLDGGCGRSMDASFSLAVAGGVGAFAGAVLGQVIQWLRDVHLSRKADRNRLQDMRREPYVRALQSLTPLRQALDGLETPLVLRAVDPESSILDELAYEKWNNASSFVKDDLPAVEQDLVLASDAVIAAFRDLSMNSAMWGGLDEGGGQVILDGDAFTLALHSKDVSALEAAMSNTRESTDVEVREMKLSYVRGYRSQLVEMMHLMRKEAGLSSEKESAYLKEDSTRLRGYRRVSEALAWRLRVRRVRRRAQSD